MGCRCFTYLPAGKVFNPSNTWKSLFKAVQEIKNDKERCSILIINDSANPVAKETKIQGYIHTPSRRLFASCFNCQFPSFAQPQQVVFRVETIEVKVNSFCKGCLEPCKITSDQHITTWVGRAWMGWPPTGLEDGTPRHCKQSRQTRYAHVGPPWPSRSQRRDATNLSRRLCTTEQRKQQRCCVMCVFCLPKKNEKNDPCGHEYEVKATG